MSNKWNFEEEKSDLAIWIESLFGAAALILMFVAVIILSAAFV